MGRTYGNGRNSPPYLRHHRSSASANRRSHHGRSRATHECATADVQRIHERATANVQRIHERATADVHSNKPPRLSLGTGQGSAFVTYGPDFVSHGPAFISHGPHRNIVEPFSIAVWITSLIPALSCGKREFKAPRSSDYCRRHRR